MESLVWASTTPLSTWHLLPGQLTHDSAPLHHSSSLSTLIRGPRPLKTASSRTIPMSEMVKAKATLSSSHSLAAAPKSLLSSSPSIRTVYSLKKSTLGVDKAGKRKAACLSTKPSSPKRGTGVTTPRIGSSELTLRIGSSELCIYCVQGRCYVTITIIIIIIIVV